MQRGAEVVARGNAQCIRCAVDCCGNHRGGRDEDARLSHRGFAELVRCDADAEVGFAHVGLDG